MWNVTDWQKVVFSDESRFVLGQMITVYECGGSMVKARVAPDFLRHFQTLPWPASPRFVPCRERGNQLKRQMPSCHSVHDLELAVQDLWPICLRTT
ncbi:transposable element Tcb2 transposase [Trichonephila clavipes]|nr:transposable element Tcb2 transposase [Trichonephila clavipes]